MLADPKDIEKIEHELPFKMTKEAREANRKVAIAAPLGANIISFPYEDMATVIRDRALTQNPESMKIVGMDLTDVVTSGALKDLLSAPRIKKVEILSFNPESDLISQICQGYRMSPEDMRDKLNENLRLLRHLAKEVKTEKLEIRLTRGLILRAVFVEIDREDKTSFAVLGNPTSPAYKGSWIAARNEKNGLICRLYDETKELWEAAVSISVVDVRTPSEGI